MKKILLFVLISLFFFSCASIKIRSSISPDFTKGSWYSKKIGVLSALSVAGTKFAAPNANDVFDRLLKKKYSLGKSPNFTYYKQVSLDMNDKNLLDTFIKVQKAYTSVKILDLKKLKIIGNKLGCDYLIFPLMLHDNISTVVESNTKKTYYETQVQIIIIDVSLGRKVFSTLITGAKDNSNWLIGGSLKNAYEKAFKAGLKRLF